MNINQEGQSIPEVTFRTRKDHEWINVSSEQIFQNRRVVVFSLPGAFTPTCSSTHVPRYNQLSPVFKQQGIDEVICISVNDAFVMNEWQKQQKADEIFFLPDGNGEFTDALGMLVDKNDLGFGRRSWRYSMLVNDGKIEKMFIEPDLPGDPFVVSDADTMLAYVSPGCAIPDDVTIFSREGCGFCVEARALLNDEGIQYNELVLNRDFSESTIRAVSGQSTLPQIFINGELIGGAEQLSQYFGEDVAA
jgi:glutaredoxin-like protein